jgi:hypothetical protein
MAKLEPSQLLLLVLQCAIAMPPVAVGAQPLDQSVQPTTTAQMEPAAGDVVGPAGSPVPLVAADVRPDPQPCGLCQRVKKILHTVDHRSELDHRDYVVSDREFKLVLKRLESGLSPLASDSAPGQAETGEQTTTGLHAQRAGGPEAAASEQRSEYLSCDECFICLDEFEQADDTNERQLTRHERPPLVITLLCRHRFHLSCIASWARARQPRSVCCPVCIDLLRLQDGQQFEASAAEKQHQ